MSKRIFKMVVPVQGKLGLRKSTRNIYKFINRVPCDADQYNRPLDSVTYVNKQLSQYPIPKRVQAAENNKREEALKEKVRQNFLKDKETRLLRVALKLQRKISYLELEELKELIPSLTKKEIKKHDKQLRMITYKINYCLQKSAFEEEFVMKSAQQIVADLQQALNSKISKIN